MNTRVFKIEELEKLNFVQLLLLNEGLKQTHPDNKQAWIELDEWIEGYVHRNADKLNTDLQANIGEVMQQANKEIPASNEETRPAAVPAEASVSRQGMFAAAQPEKAEKSEQAEKRERKSVLEEFLEEQENSWCPVM